MVLLIGSFTIGLVLSLLSLGALISFRVLGFRDLTIDGSITLGGAVAAILLVNSVNPIVATGAAFLAGMAAGSVTGLLHTRCKINGLLAGILVMTALYSINLRIMGKSNLPLLTETTLVSYATRMADRLAGSQPTIQFASWEVRVQDLCVILLMFGVVVLSGLAMYAFFKTNLGLAMRATGDNDQMIRALGVDVGWMITLGLAMANGLVALAGGLLVQYQGFADVQMGIGMVVWGLASMIIGETLVGDGHMGLRIVGVVMGAVLFRLLVAIALRMGLNPNDLKLITALFVFAALVLPDILKRLKHGTAAQQPAAH